MKEFIRKIKPSVDTIVALVTIIYILFQVFLAIDDEKFKEEDTLPRLGKIMKFAFLYIYININWIKIAIVLLISSNTILWYRYYLIKKQLTLGFIDSLKAPINQKWDYTGNWSVNDNELCVTNSDVGGITKNGAFWENYIFSFEANIVNDCLGVIIRAEDLDDYFMLQITSTEIRPHIRKRVFKNNSNPINTPSMGGIVYAIDNLETNWFLLGNHIVRHRQSLNMWFECTIIVKGLSARMKFNNVEVFNGEALPLNASGKVGFRNFNHEEALIRKIKVKLL